MSLCDPLLDTELVLPTTAWGTPRSPHTTPPPPPSISLAWFCCLTLPPFEEVDTRDAEAMFLEPVIAKRETVCKQCELRYIVTVISSGGN